MSQTTLSFGAVTVPSPQPPHHEAATCTEHARCVVERRRSSGTELITESGHHDDPPPAPQFDPFTVALEEEQTLWVGPWGEPTE